MRGGWFGVRHHDGGECRVEIKLRLVAREEQLSQEPGITPSAAPRAVWWDRNLDPALMGYFEGSNKLEIEKGGATRQDAVLKIIWIVDFGDQSAQMSDKTAPTSKV